MHFHKLLCSAGQSNYLNIRTETPGVLIKCTVMCPRPKSAARDSQMPGNVIFNDFLVNDVFLLLVRRITTENHNGSLD